MNFFRIKYAVIKPSVVMKSTRGKISLVSSPAEFTLFDLLTESQRLEFLELNQTLILPKSTIT